MSKLLSHSSWFLSIYLTFCVGYCCLVELTDDKKAQETESLSGALDPAIEVQRRREIAENYLKDLQKGKEHWVDPYNMLNYREDRQIVTTKLVRVDNSDSKKEEGAVTPFKQICSTSVKNELHMDSDLKPMFSDIKGEVIGSDAFENDGITFPNNLKDSLRTSSDDKREMCVLDSIYISRWIKKLIKKIEKETYSNHEFNSFTFPLSKDFVDSLEKMLLSKSFDVGDLDAVITDFIAKAVITSENEGNYLNITTYLISFMWAFAIFSSILVFSYIILQCILHHPRLTVFWFLVSVSIMWHWMHLYKQKLAFKHAELSSMTVPSQCRKNEFGLFEHIQEYIRSYFSSNECQKYYEALMVDPFWEVSFSVAASEAIAAMLFQPLNAASRAINYSVKQLFDGLSIFTIIPLTLFLFLVIAMIFNYKVKFPFFMGSLEPSASSLGNCVEDLNSAKAVSDFRNEIVDSISGNLNEQNIAACASACNLNSDRIIGNNKNINFPQYRHMNSKLEFLSGSVGNLNDIQLYSSSTEVSELCSSHSSGLENDCTECKEVNDNSDCMHLSSDEEKHCIVDPVNQNTCTKEAEFQVNSCECSKVIKNEIDVQMCDVELNLEESLKKVEVLSFVE